MKLQVKLVKSLIGRKPNQVKTAYALGLKKINQVVLKDESDAIRGMISTISHLVDVKEI